MGTRAGPLLTSIWPIIERKRGPAVATAVVERFTCGHCEKQFAWKPELAGRKAKCKGCGNVLTVPTALSPAASTPAARKRPAVPPPPPPPAQQDDDEGAYDFASESDPPPTTFPRPAP